MRDLANFSLDDVSECGDVLRAIAQGAHSMEEVAQRVVRYLYDQLGDGAGERACVLVRLYKTHPFGQLEPALQDFAVRELGSVPDASTRCFTLLGTAGVREEWNDRRLSRGHQAIPLPSGEIVHQLPMVMQLIRQLGLDVESVVQPAADPRELISLSQRAYDVFHVEEAEGSPELPAQQDFIVPYGVRSALGFGGMLYTGDFYAVVLFSRVRISADVAQRLKILGVALRVPLLTFARGPIFDAAAAA